MPLIETPINKVPYYLNSFDAFGDEVADELPDKNNPGKLKQGLMSEFILEEATRIRPTDIFIVSHGWRGDRAGAIDQYDRWIDMMADVKTVSKVMVIAIHWPSEPFGDEGDQSLKSIAVQGISGIKSAVDAWGQRFNKRTDKFKTALEKVITAAVQSDFPKVKNQLRDSYKALDKEQDFGANGNTPIDDRMVFDEQKMFDYARETYFKNGGSAGAVWDAILLPLRLLSVWSMKARALQVAENGPRKLLSALQETLNGKTRIHLAGHSFGTIVASGIAFGDNKSFPVVAVNSIVLIQGAVSHWSYASKNPYMPVPGYFYEGFQRLGVAGPLITTQSSFDTANCTFYPLAAALGEQVAMAEQQIAPRYGALGQFGIWDGQAQAETFDLKKLTVQGPLQSFEFKSRTRYNVMCDAVICAGGGFSGAHNDIVHPEIANIIWKAAGL